ncbi:MAG: N-acetyltransferase [Candidatus Margulisbacteria bacterium]|jgi:amino-acid N-acetyltransferase|nr:N-acetyltransferase [Candidatus Margulisiibacteriota bacterium]
MAKTIIRRATIKDVDAILNLINGYAAEGLMLRRAEDAVIQNLRDFSVAAAARTVLGCAALHLYTDRLSEIKSLAVAREYTGQGIATKLIKRCLAEAKSLGVPKVFTLTYVPELFLKNKFQLSVKELLPQKILEECQFCPRRDDCQEVCLVYNLQKIAS